jgi:hypothetical protein
MPEHSIMVWDLETVPDLAAAARLFDMADASDAEVREAQGSGFPNTRFTKSPASAHWLQADSRRVGA